MLVLQPRQSGHNIRRERAVPKNVGSFTTQLLQSETTCSVPEGRENGFKFSSEVAVFSYSGWAGDETEKSSSAVVALVERHLLEAYTRKQKIIARSSAEADLYAGASEAKEIQSMMYDLGLAVKPVLIIDAKATEHTLHSS